MNLNTLKTLPEDQFASGMGEVLKSGLIRDARFYEWTINHMSEIQERIYPVLVKMVRNVARSRLLSWKVIRRNRENVHC